MIESLQKFIGKLTKEKGAQSSVPEFAHVAVSVTGTLPLSSASVRLGPKGKNSSAMAHLAECRWYRIVENRSFLVAEDEHTYHFSVDDVGAYVQCALKSDQGESESALFGPIKLDGEVQSFVQRALGENNALFSVNASGVEKVCALQLSAGKLRLKLGEKALEWGAVDAEETCSPLDPFLAVIDFSNCSTPPRAQCQALLNAQELRLKFISPLQRDKFVLLVRLYAQLRAVPVKRALRALEHGDESEDASLAVTEEIEQLAKYVKDKFDESRRAAKQLSRQYEGLTSSIEGFEQDLQKRIEELKKSLASPGFEHEFDRQRVEKSILDIENRRTERMKVRARTELSLCHSNRQANPKQLRPEKSLMVDNAGHARPRLSKDAGLLARIQQNAEAGIETTLDLHASHPVTLTQLKLDETDNSQHRLVFFEQEFDKLRAWLVSLHAKSPQPIAFSKLLSSYLAKCEGKMPELLEIENELLRERVGFLARDLAAMSEKAPALAADDAVTSAGLIEGPEVCEKADDPVAKMIEASLARQKELKEALERKESSIRRLSEENSKLADLCAQLQELDSANYSTL